MSTSDPSRPGRDGPSAAPSGRPSSASCGPDRRHFLKQAGLGLLALSTGLGTAGWSSSPSAATQFGFSSFPDFFNWDIPYPQPGYEEAITWFIETMKADGAEFGLVAGDMMDARWKDSLGQARQHALAYWGGWVARMEDHDFPFYVVPGDHERGDNPVNPAVVPAFERTFREVFRMPDNGPPSKKGLAYHFSRGNTLFVGVDTFDLQGEEVRWVVEGEQLEWFEQVLADHRDKEHIIVQGHVPVLPDVSSRRSSAIVMAEGNGPETDFWRAMVDHGVDAYLCGEHHDITATKRDGVWQIVHGAIWGGLSPINYLQGAVDGDTLRLTLKEVAVEFSGDPIWHVNRSPDGRPPDTMTVPDEVREQGPTEVGTLVRSGGEDVERTGAFA
jgi:hypothetical protein